jgi:hypothetical protein
VSSTAAPSAVARSNAPFKARNRSGDKQFTLPSSIVIAASEPLHE